MYNRRWYQDEAEFVLLDHLQTGKPGNPIVAMPTGTGKGFSIARLIRTIYSMWTDKRVMMLTHVKELIEQNAEKLHELWPTAPFGIYSAGLNSRDMIMPIVFGGVKSVANAIEKSNQFDDGRPAHMRHFGWRDLLIIDECHLLSPEEDTEYNYVIAELRKINPYLVVIGFTATPYRLKLGMLTEGGIFTHIIYDVTGVEAFNRLIAEGFLSPLIPKPTSVTMNMQNVGLVGGDFNNKQASNEAEKILYDAVRETVQYGLEQQRNAWLLFTQSVDNAEHAAAMLQSFGIDALAVHSKLKPKENDSRIRAYKAGELRALVNMGKLTTGFDHPPIDLIGMLRATMSPGLWVQMLGRGTRPAPWVNKRNCLVLDFAKNTPRLGPINDPRIPKKPGKGGGDAPIKICEKCNTYNHPTAKKCISCGEEFTFESKLKLVFSVCRFYSPLHRIGV